jgi:hypothetical protein
MKVKMTVGRVLYLDLANATHRARGGFTLGPAPVVFNFFRSLRALVELIKPTRIVMVDEGEPKKKLELCPEYKANRIIPVEDFKKHEEMRRYREQRDVCHDLLKKYFPVSVVRHADYEADDLLATMISRGTTAVEAVVVSTDSDFIQLLNKYDHVKLYHPIKKTFIEKPSYCYATWKSLRGDPTDNIDPVLDGSQVKIDVKAEDVVDNPAELMKIFSDEKKAVKFFRNMQLIQFEDISDEELLEVTSSQPTKDWEAVKKVFSDYGFNSIIKEGTWEKFMMTFDPMWGENVA